MFFVILLVFLLFSIIAVSGLLKHGIKSVITARGLQKTARWFGFSFPITVMSEFFLSTTTCNLNYPVLHCGLVTSIAFILTPVFIIKLTCDSALNTDHLLQLLALAAVWLVTALVVSLNIVISRSSNYSKFCSSKPISFFYQKPN